MNQNRHSTRVGKIDSFSTRRIARLAAFAGLITAAAAPVPAGAQEGFPTYPAASPIIPQAPAGPAVYFEWSNLFGLHDTVRYARVPVRTLEGKLLYWDVTTKFNVSDTGVLTIAPGYPKIVRSALPPSGNLVAGRYVHATNATYQATLKGPGVGPAGFSVWTWQKVADASTNTIPNVATFYVGSITSTKHPLYIRLKKAGITSTWYIFGEVSEGGVNPNFQNGDLIGITQNGGTLTIYGFTDTSAVDQQVPVDHVVYNLKP